MIRYGKNTKLGADKVLKRARAFFGPGGLGLDESESDDCHVRFQGGGGFVLISVCAGDKGTEVDLSTQEWENPVREFIGSV